MGAGAAWNLAGGECYREWHGWRVATLRSTAGEKRPERQRQKMRLHLRGFGPYFYDCTPDSEGLLRDSPQSHTSERRRHLHEWVDKEGTHIWRTRGAALSETLLVKPADGVLLVMRSGLDQSFEVGNGFAWRV
jgi:hypothetical protein